MCTKNNCVDYWHNKNNAQYFSTIKKQKKNLFNDKKHIIKMQFHNSQKKFKQIRTQFRKICFDKWQTRIDYDRFENYKQFYIATINRQIGNNNEIQKKFIQFDDIKWKFVIKRRRTNFTKNRINHVDNEQLQKIIIFEYCLNDQSRYRFKIFLITILQFIHKLNEKTI